VIRQYMPATIIGSSVVLSLAVAQARAADCRPSLIPEVQAAMDSHDLARMQSLYPDAEVCDAQTGATLGQRIAARLFNSAIENNQRDQALLRQSVTYARLWQPLEALGELADEQKNFDEASVLYQEAMAQIANLEVTPKAPPADQIRILFAKTARANQLAKHYHNMPRGRDGKIEGFGKYEVRDVVFSRLPLPIQFETGQTEFTPNGAAAAEDLVSLLEGEPPSGRVLVRGYTDERGSDAYNLTLSQHRAEAVVAYLRQHLTHVSAEFVPVGLGKVHFDPAQTANLTNDEREELEQQLSHLTTEERQQMDRRVEIVR
jgi:outer membrane protein OmpA-like peptidoglycan-associated protein